MAEAATRWISPFWGTLRTYDDPESGGGTESIAAAQVWVLNLGEQGKLTLNWYDQLGTLAYSEESTPNMHTVDGPSVPNVGGWGAGWLRIVSTSPVLPWGITPVYPRSGSSPALPPPPTPQFQSGWVNMVFYREDPISIPNLPDIPMGPQHH
jgi:hypothetical protein